jgi:hypothetical protein
MAARADPEIAGVRVLDDELDEWRTAELPGHRPGCVRDARWKLVRRLGDDDQFYDLQGLNHEGDDLLLGPLTSEQAAAIARLREAMRLLLEPDQPTGV